MFFSFDNRSVSRPTSSKMPTKITSALNKPRSCGVERKRKGDKRVERKRKREEKIKLKNTMPTKKKKEESQKSMFILCMDSGNRKDWVSCNCNSVETAQPRD